MTRYHLIHSDDVGKTPIRAVTSFSVDINVIIGQEIITEFDAEYGAYFPVTIINDDGQIIHVDTRIFHRG